MLAADALQWLLNMPRLHWRCDVQRTAEICALQNSSTPTPLGTCHSSIAVPILDLMKQGKSSNHATNVAPPLHPATYCAAVRLRSLLTSFDLLRTPSWLRGAANLGNRVSLIDYLAD